MAPIRRRVSRMHGPNISGAKKFYHHALTLEEMLKLIDDGVGLAIVTNRVPEYHAGSADSRTTVWLVFPDPSQEVGHYITTIKRSNGTLIFDPYGRRDGLPHPTELLPPLPGPFSENPYNFEGAPKPTINTCGEWAAIRAQNPNMSHEKFEQEFGHYSNQTVGQWAFEYVQKRQAHNEAFAEQAEINKTDMEAKEEEAKAGAGVEQMEVDTAQEEPGVTDPAMQPKKSSFLRPL
jgi:hypothetical protein